MRILVAGGTGFAGTALTRRLLDHGHEVVVLDKDEGLAGEELRRRGAKIVLGSITDRATVKRCVERANVVFNLAAAFREVGVPESHYRAVNVEAARDVAEAALEAGVGSLVHCSTCGVHGNIDDPPADEDAPIAPADYYQETKYLGEVAVREVAEGGMRTVVIRPTAIYGPGDPGRFRMIFEWVDRGFFPMFGDGRTLYHPLYVSNLTDAFVLAMEPGRGDGGTYLIADERYVEIEELVRAAGRAIGRKVRVPHLPVSPVVAAGHVMQTLARPFDLEPPIFPRRVDWFRQDRAFDISRARAELGYDPKVDLEEGLRRAGAWYREHGYI